jgi:uncharacterized protein (DUF1778 family)
MQLRKIRQKIFKQKAKESGAAVGDANVDATISQAADDSESLLTKEAIKAAYKEQMLLQAVENLNIKNRESKGFLDLLDDGVPRDESLLVCQEYLRETAEREEYDCESIISSYSTTDNHPAKISVCWC